MPRQPASGAPTLHAAFAGSKCARRTRYFFPPGAQRTPGRRGVPVPGRQEGVRQQRGRHRQRCRAVLALERLHVHHDKQPGILWVLGWLAAGRVIAALLTLFSPPPPPAALGLGVRIGHGLCCALLAAPCACCRAFRRAALRACCRAFRCAALRACCRAFWGCGVLRLLGLRGGSVGGGHTCGAGPPCTRPMRLPQPANGLRLACRSGWLVTQGDLGISERLKRYSSAPAFCLTSISESHGRAAGGCPQAPRLAGPLEDHACLARQLNNQVNIACRSLSESCTPQWLARSTGFVVSARERFLWQSYHSLPGNRIGNHDILQERKGPVRSSELPFFAAAAAVPPKHTHHPPTPNTTHHLTHTHTVRTPTSPYTRNAHRCYGLPCKLRCGRCRQHMHPPPVQVVRCYHTPLLSLPCSNSTLNPQYHTANCSPAQLTVHRALHQAPRLLAKGGTWQAPSKTVRRAQPGKRGSGCSTKQNSRPEMFRHSDAAVWLQTARPS